MQSYPDKEEHMVHEEGTTQPADEGSVERPVGRPVPARDKPLSCRQRERLKQATDEWARLPTGVGCTNSTLEALERRALVETRARGTSRAVTYRASM